MKMTDQELKFESQRNESNSKRLLMKDHQLDSQLKDIQRETDEIEMCLSDFNNYINKLAFEQHKQNLESKLEELEFENIELEKKCLEAGKGEDTPLINEIIEEFLDKYLEEKSKNKRLGLYIKKEYVNSKKEQLENLERSLSTIQNELKFEQKRIDELEEEEGLLLQNISILEELVKNRKSEIS